MSPSGGAHFPWHFIGIMKAKKATRVAVDGGMVGGEWSCRIYRSGPGSVSRHYAWSVLRSCHTDLQPKAMDTEDWGSNLPSFIGCQQFHLSNLKPWTRHFQWTIALSSLIIPSCLRRWSSISTWSDKHRPLMSSRDENFRADAEFSEISSQNEAKVDLWRSSRSPLCSCTSWRILANSKDGACERTWTADNSGLPWNKKDIKQIGNLPSVRAFPGHRNTSHTAHPAVLLQIRLPWEYFSDSWPFHLNPAWNMGIPGH